MAVLTEEQTMLRDGAKQWASEQSPVAALRRLRDGGSGRAFDAEAWGQMAEMGWAGVVIPEAHGGSDFGWLSLGLVLEEAGRTLTASPLVSAAGASAALLLGGSEALQGDWLPKLAAGEAVIALAVDETAHHAPARTALKATADGAHGENGWRLQGTKTLVFDGMEADAFVVAARTGGHAGEADGITLFLVEADQGGVQRKALKLVDSRPAAALTLDVTVGADAVLGEVGQGGALLDRVLDRTRAALAAEMLGTASQAFDVTLEYLKTRTQFGQLIGSFQSLQHRAAKWFTELEMTRSCVEAALTALDSTAAAGEGEIPALVSLAKAKASETLHLASNEMVQMHGGIGMTDAHDAGLYMKRARVAEAGYGSASFHRDRYARLLGY